MTTNPTESQAVEQALAQLDAQGQSLLKALDSMQKQADEAMTIAESMRNSSLIARSLLHKMTTEHKPPLPAADKQTSQSAVTEINSFLDFAIAVISAWQGGTWGLVRREPLAYGLFAFHGEQLQRVLHAYASREKQSPPQNPSTDWLAEKANDPHMRSAQMKIARQFLLDVTRLSIDPRGVRSPLGKLMIMDAAVDHGLTHPLLKNTELSLGLDVLNAAGRYTKPYLPARFNDETAYFQQFARERMNARAAEWKSLSQRDRARYEWFSQRAQERDMRLDKQPNRIVHLPAINIKIPLPAAAPNPSDPPTQTQPLVYGSPVDPTARAVLPRGWRSAIDHMQIYAHGKFRGQMHTGLDINRSDDADEGLPVYAVADGTIAFAGLGAGAWGNLVVIRHPDGMWSRYGHLKRIAANIKTGAPCLRGALLGTIGRGHKRQFNAHLHFDMCRTTLWRDNPSWWSAKNPAEIAEHYVNPQEFIAAKAWWRR